ncbi:MAG: hypothetical protein QM774_13875 [Gordonia sp. (in: high G+C Gram-positive bacteria)]|uniref:antitoxin VbhA family protein n=1 Tax=Gordonia sp. (in: high G+C Gram-positive bacteria) TaxID=84139 RepID=UPI0039E2562B
MAAPLNTRQEELLAETEGILAAAGHRMSDEGRADLISMLNGEITEDEAVRRVIARAKRDK